MAVTKPELWTIRQERTQPTPDAQFEAEQAERKAIFDRIAPKGELGWKGPIDAVILDHEFADCNEAAIWFTGCSLIWEGRVDATHVRVTGPGYYETIGA